MPPALSAPISSSFILSATFEPASPDSVPDSTPANSIHRRDMMLAPMDTELTTPVPAYQPSTSPSRQPYLSIQPQAAVNLSQRILEAQRGLQTQSRISRHTEVYFTTTFHPQATPGLMVTDLWSIEYVPPESRRVLRPNDLMRNVNGEVIGRYLGIEGRYGEHLILRVLVVVFEANMHTHITRTVLKIVGARALPYSVQDTPRLNSDRRFDEELVFCGKAIYDPASFFSCISLLPYIRLW